LEAESCEAKNKMHSSNTAQHIALGALTLLEEHPACK